MEHIIPEMTDPLGQCWEQPVRQDILIGDDTAIMPKAAYDQLKEYSTTLPSGVYPGKMWKRIEIDAAAPFTVTAYLGWYGMPMGITGRFAIHWRKIVIGDWKALYGTTEAKPAQTGVKTQYTWGVGVKKPLYVANLTGT